MNGIRFVLTLMPCMLIYYGDENHTDEGHNSDFTINIRRRNLLIISDFETSDSDDTEFEHEENNSTMYWSENVNIILFLLVFPRNLENISDILDLFIDDD